jgi:phosphosulfolactate phosphohydrolase-like enzyme
MAARKTVRIDVLPESAWRYSGYDAIVCVDVLLSATTIVTAVAQGRRVTLAADVKEPAARGAANSGSQQSPLVLTDDVAAPAVAGTRFSGPAALAADPSGRPVLHVSSFGAMVVAASERARVYVACLRNFEATANEIALQHKRVVLIGAGQDGEVCSADQMATAGLAIRLQGRDFDLEGRNTNDEVSRWGSSDVSLIGLSRSAERLRGRGHGAEVEFVLGHVNDRSVVCVYEAGEVYDPVAKRRRLEEETPTPAWGIPGVPAR